MVLGGASSGKSEFAEGLSGEGGAAKIYLACMKNDGQEARERIGRHRRLRAGKGFETLEAASLAELEALLERPELFSGKTVLLETLSVLMANEMFSECGIFKNPGMAEGIAERMMAVLARIPCGRLIAVSDEIFYDGGRTETGEAYDPATLAYLRALGELHARFGRTAHLVTEVVFGCPYNIRKEMGDMMDGDIPRGLHLLTGGAFQGQEEYAAKAYPGVTLLPELSAEFRRLLAEGREPETAIASLLSDEGDKVVIALEIGGGVVPLDPFERGLRERYGRFVTGLSEKAVSVERLLAGLPLRLK